MAVLSAGEGAHGEAVPLLGIDGHADIPDEIGDLIGKAANELGILVGGGPLGGDFDLLEVLDPCVHCLVVHLKDFFALLAVGMVDGILHVFDGVVEGNDVGELEEGGLHDHVRPVAQPDLLGDVRAVEDVEGDVVVGEVALHPGGEVVLEILKGRPLGVEKEGAALLQPGEDVVEMDVLLLVAGDEIGVIDEVGGLDGLLAEAEMGDCDSAGFLRVVGKIPLGVEIRLVADDLDGVLVRAHGAVGAETPELGADGAFWGGHNGLACGKGGSGHVINDPEGEVILGRVEAEVVEDGLDVGGSRILGAEAVPSAHDEGLLGLVLEHGADVLIEGLAESSGLLAAVEHGDALHRCGEDVEEILLGEGAVEMDFHDAGLLSPGVEIVHGLLDGLADRAHGDDDVLGIGSAVVIEGVVLPSGKLFDLIHVGFHEIGNGLVEGVDGFLRLEEDVGVLGGSLYVGVLRVEPPGLEAGKGVIVHELREIVVVKDVYLLDLVGCPEAVEEGEEGKASLDGAEMGDGGEVHDLLNASRGEKGES